MLVTADMNSGTKQLHQGSSDRAIPGGETSEDKMCRHKDVDKQMEKKKDDKTMEEKEMQQKEQAKVRKKGDIYLEKLI